MPANSDRQQFRNEDLLLSVSPAVDRVRWDESRYEGFLDELCVAREYQKEAIRAALRYLLGGEYSSLRDLAHKNFDEKTVLQERYGSWDSMQRYLQLPEQLSASLDLATGTGKSYVMYGIAAILLAEGTVDRVLVLCPSTTIELGLLTKFRDLASDDDLQGLLPEGAKVTSPTIINANDSITEGSICVENYHAILENTGSSIRDSLTGKGARVAVLNDEAHHVANESAAKAKKWKTFLTDPAYGFRLVIGVSGTCYVGNDYFSDVIFRYSLRQAMEERFVKRVDYIAEMPRTTEHEEKWQLIRNRHEDTRKKLKRRKIAPLTIIVTPTIAKCQDVTEELKGFLIDHAGMSPEQVDEQVLCIYNGAPDIGKLPYVDVATSKVEWIVSVSMLNEGWDVKRVFQIVPHEERAFNSKLLIAQVLGRGLRVPEDWTGEQPEVTVFNHDAWAVGIRHLVQEILEIEKRVPALIVPSSAHHFDLHNIDYTIVPTSVKKPMKGDYNLLAKGFVDLATDKPAEEVVIDFERAATGERYKWQTKVEHKTYTPREVALAMYERLEQAVDPAKPPQKGQAYTDQFPVDRLEKIVRDSLEKLKTDKATESMKQKFLQSLGPLRRKTSENVRYTPVIDRHVTLSTKARQQDSVSASELRKTKSYFYTDETEASLRDEQIEFWQELTEAGSGYKVVFIANRHDFKTPLCGVIADSDPEKRFINFLVQPANVVCYTAWIKSTAIRFYEIEYSWKKGSSTKRGKFSPDFFIKVGDLILVVEIKGDEELREPTEENRKKNEYAIAHFARVNEHLEAVSSPVRYKFNFLSASSFNKFFQSLRDGTIAHFRSELDVKLLEEE